MPDTLLPLHGKIAIVTGASSGLGYATVQGLVAAGASVIATARRAERLEALQSETGCEFIAGDAADTSTCDSVMELALNKFGRVDILVNNAGIGNYKQLIDTTLDDYDDLMRTNMRSSFLFSRAVAPHMVAQRSGTILFVSSVAGVAGTANEAVYSATKFAQVGFAQSLDQELYPYGIKVTALIAGGMKTEFALGKGRDPDAIQKSPMMEPHVAAQSIVFICSQPEGVRIPTFTLRHMGIRK